MTPASDDALPDGAYESLITDRLGRELQLLRPEDWNRGAVALGDQPHVLAAHVADIVHRKLRSLSDPEDRMKLVNQLVGLVDDEETVPEAVRLLTVERRSDNFSAASRFSVRPQAPLAEAALLTNARGEPSLQAEILAEIPSADEVDLLCAFVKWTGVRTLRPGLSTLRDRNVPLRIVTTTYMGATEREALDRLVREVGAQIKVQYDVQRTRLHAKAWMFRRRSGFSTAYVGSSNLSHSALLDGVEWNVRLSQRANPALLGKFEATFDTYWDDPSFEAYDPDTLQHRDRLDDALAEASGRASHSRVTITLSGLEVRPYAYQQRMLDDLTRAREVYDRHRNLVVAATGTGKTVVAALDYRSLSESATSPAQRPSLLFVAHRKEILTQALRTFREVLGDPNFGELYVDGIRPERGRHVFASIQSLNAYGVDRIPPDTFDALVIDEFHHAAARTYRQLLEHLRPQETVGLTATPERADGVNVAAFFGAAPTTELRLWDAISSDLLTPFHYFVINDETDLSRIKWERGAYSRAALSEVYTGNDARTRIILNELADKVADLGSMKALGFCVDVAHAHAMARAFNDAGIAAEAVTGDTRSSDRENALAALRDGAIKVIFAVDVFNEGLDVPDVNTVLFLRPTESATVFVQQLGRGLRRTRSKSVLTVLDFVGLQRREFRWDLKLRALTGLTRRGLEDAIKNGFSSLPSGSQIVLERESQERILANVRAQTMTRWPQLVAELDRLGDVSLGTYLHETGVDLTTVIGKSDRSWTKLRRDAGLDVPPAGPSEDRLLRRVRALAHIDDPERAAAYLRILSGADRDQLSTAERRYAEMLFFSLYPDGGGHESITAGLRALREEPAAMEEFRAVVDVARSEKLQLTYEPGRGLADVPMRVHASYQREEVLSALGYASLSRRPNSFREGVLYAADRNIDALFVTIEKSEASFSPTTMYRDYPISRTLFHWESQSTTSLASRTGQRYVTGASTVLLLVRVRAKGEFGTQPYINLGPVSHVSHQGERPIAITWKLAVPMPTELFTQSTAAAS